MTNSRRRSDIGSQNPNLSTGEDDLQKTDPIERRYQTLLTQHLSNLNAQIDLSHANAKLRAENERLKEDVSALYRKAYFDELTGLPNQRLLKDSFDQAVATGDNIVLLFIDLNKFKYINDTFGHHIGDEALKLASNTLASLTRSTDVIAPIYEVRKNPQNHLPVRYAGDEFIILFRGTTLEDLQKKISDVKNAFSTLTLNVGDTKIPVNASIGAYEYQKGDTLDHCKKQADIAMYAEKKSSKLDSTSLPFGRFAGYILPASTGYVPTTTGYSLIPQYNAPKVEPS
ncbi:MAG: hypothetical protein A3B66_09385 [Alphaproteobacteria bacterium RIFCSPHIGHO2_02_FULL_46_13]|nr:MAG: hypothetical protein A3B66_09385 [Alphaproteobacteria bacterium RIFCSPHIGHO2_02_FULL_46_13]